LKIFYDVHIFIVRTPIDDYTTGPKLIQCLKTSEAKFGMETGFQTLVHLKAFLLAVIHSLVEGSRTLQPMLKKVALVMCGGSLGAASRYSIGLLAAKTWGTQFPWGTLAANLLGCFLIGLIFALADRVRLLSPDMRLLLITGYLGALTTFSSFALETVNAGRAGLMLQPLVNILVNNLAGITLTFLGLWIGSLK
jgi:fluoride exporter